MTFDKNIQIIGEGAIIMFHNENAIRYPKTYTITKNRLFEILESRQGGKGLTQMIGDSIVLTEMENEDVGDAMKELAKKSNGGIPSNSSFISALQNQSQKFSFSSAGEISIEIAKDLAEKTAKGGQKILDVGETAIDTTDSLVSSLKWLTPFAIVMILVIVLIFFYKGNKIPFVG